MSLLNVDESTVTVSNTQTGGGYGGKHWKVKAPALRDSPISTLAICSNLLFPTSAAALSRV